MLELPVRLYGHRCNRTAEFHVRRAARDAYGFDDAFFSLRGDVVLAKLADARRFAAAYNRARPEAEALSPLQLFMMGLLHEIAHLVIDRWRAGEGRGAFQKMLDGLRATLGDDLGSTLRTFVDRVPPTPVYRGRTTPEGWLAESMHGVANEEWMLEELLLHWLANENPSYAAAAELVSDDELRRSTKYLAVVDGMRQFFAAHAKEDGEGRRQDLLEALLAPIRHAPASLAEQLAYMQAHFGVEIDPEIVRRALLASDVAREEANWLARRGQPMPEGGKSEPFSTPLSFGGDLFEVEPENFSPDLDWMPRVVMIAKSTFVWLDQLARTYRREVKTLADVPDEELDRLARSGFTALWLIGIWRRSEASRSIKQMMGNPDAAASAYALHDYVVADDLGGEPGWRSLRDRAAKRGIQLASDMVPNHVGIDGKWVVEHPDWFVQVREPPFPVYRFTGADLGSDPSVGVFIEDGYWSKSDAAVVFKREDRRTGDVRYVYHGNDGTSMPWNDTAQLDYLNPEVREAVIQTILHVARMFPVIRFDAAMTLAKRHYQRLWYPLPGTGGDIPSRAEHAMTAEQFNERFPIEFWREVVDRVAVECPNTLLLAEAFWMMEGYFVRTLGMHRVYNSAFMNMLKREQNAEYRKSIKNVLEFNPQILKRYVNFMNNPDEETAVAQFGNDDRYFGVCTVMSTMPGLPMFGHGQIEGFTEKYGMEYRRARKEESPDEGLVARHEREIFPLLKKRYLFSDVAEFLLYDFIGESGAVDEDVYAYSNRRGSERALVVFHNRFKDTRGWIRHAAPFVDEGGGTAHRTLADGLALGGGGADGDRFTVMRDHVSGLEILRENRELAERGLYVELGAFKYHVFWDIREVVHTEERPYRDLAQRLAGRPVPSVEAAIAEIVLAPVHDPIVEALGPGGVASPEAADAAAVAAVETETADADADAGAKTKVDVATTTAEAGAAKRPAVAEVRSTAKPEAAAAPRPVAAPTEPSPPPTKQAKPPVPSATSATSATGATGATGAAGAAGATGATGATKAAAATGVTGAAGGTEGAKAAEVTRATEETAARRVPAARSATSATTTATAPASPAPAGRAELAATVAPDAIADAEDAPSPSRALLERVAAGVARLRRSASPLGGEKLAAIASAIDRRVARSGLLGLPVVARRALLARAWLDAAEILVTAAATDPSNDPLASLHLDDAVTRASRAAGLPDDDARRVAALAHLLRGAERRPLEGRLARLLEDPAAQAYVDVHTHEGVAWFSKERLEELAAAVDAYAWVCGIETTRPTAWPTPAVARVAALAVASGYRFAALRSALARSA